MLAILSAMYCFPSDFMFSSHCPIRRTIRNHLNFIIINQNEDFFFIPDGVVRICLYPNNVHINEQSVLEAVNKGNLVEI